MNRHKRAANIAKKGLVFLGRWVWVLGLGLDDGVDFEIWGLGVSVWFLVWALVFGIGL